MEQFKCRASGAGKLMTNPRNKTELLSETTKTFVEECIKSQIYGFKKEISSKQIEKGLEYEDLAIEKTIEWLDLPFALKNEQRFEDDYFTGEPDIIIEKDNKPFEIIDIKNSWDCFTFPLFDKEIPTKDYMYQVQVYMHLTGAKKASVVYVLLNTPETYNSMEMDYSNVETKYRIKRYEFEYDEEIINQLKTKIYNVREYIKTLEL